MKKILFFLVTLLTITACEKENIVLESVTPAKGGRITAGTSNVPVNGVMLQGFYWDVPKTTNAGSWWQNLGAKATELSDAGFTAVWLPPAYKGAGFGATTDASNDVGYAVYDRYDLGEFNQRNSVRTRYGTVGELTSAISAFKNKGVQVYEDFVMNHMMGADYSQVVNGNTVWTGFNFTGRNNTYSAFKWNKDQFNGCQQYNSWIQWNAWDFNPYNNNDSYDNLMGCEIRYAGNSAAIQETINWGNWLTNKMSLDGYRLDATKHIHTPFVNQWIDQVTANKFVVSEAWMNSVPQLQNYVNATGGRTALFDVPLHYSFNAMSNGNGSWDMSGLAFAGFTEANGPLSVSFVENHDTEQGKGLESPVLNFKMLAYTYILTRDKGYPCVYYRDYYEYGLGSQIKQIMKIRKENGFGAGYEYTNINDSDVYVYSRNGDATHPGMLVMLNDGSSPRSKTITTPFKNATLSDKTGRTSGTITTDANGTGTFPVNARDYAVWVPNVTPVATTIAVTFTLNQALGSCQTAQVLVGGGQPVTLTNAGTNLWKATVNLNKNFTTTYKYSISTNGTVLSETANRSLTTGTGATQTLASNTWAGSSVPTCTVSTNSTSVTFNINYSNTVTGQDLYIVGSTPQLGSWNTANAIKMSGSAWPNWSLTLAMASGTQVQYKYIRKDAVGNVLWQSGANKVFTPTGGTMTRTDTW